STNRTIDEKDQGGGSRDTTENNSTGQIVLLKSGQAGKEQPVIIQEERPAIRGILVVADGAKDPLIRKKLLRAVETVLDLDVHRISVFSRKGR
ncbi:MAG TPA: stage III sporulation protein AG, partial [Clostridia bacterium]|nr:stage III sporulation protein AG [Clostridia bacterium]